MSLVLMQHGKVGKGAKFTNQYWPDPFAVKEVSNTRYMLEQDNKRKARNSVHIRHLRKYTACNSLPEFDHGCLHLGHGAEHCSTKTDSE